LAPFTFDSSQHLNCHSNFIGKIAVLERKRSRVRGKRRSVGTSGHYDRRWGSKMTSVEIAAGSAQPRSADDCFGLGMVFSAGAGVAVDLVEAHKWFNIAATRGHKDAARLRREVAEQMSDAEIGCAQRAARDWLKTNPQHKAQTIRAAA
jgi:hypothetical protein